MTIRVTLTDEEVSALLSVLHGAMDDASDDSDDEYVQALESTTSKIRRAQRKLRA